MQGVDHRLEGEYPVLDTAKAPAVTRSSPTFGSARSSDLPLDAFDCSTGFSTGYADASSSGTSEFKRGKRFRPPKKMRRFKPNTTSSEVRGEVLTEKEELLNKGGLKRRAEAVVRVFRRVARRSKTEVVPHEGLPNQ